MIFLFALIFFLFLVVRKRQGTKATMRSGQTQTLMQGSDVRWHREPTGKRMGRKSMK